jgi:5-formyltetrahydrofolate cyclo-ligase
VPNKRGLRPLVDLNAPRDALRAGMRARRRGIPAASRIAAAEALAARVLALPFLPRAGAVAGYWAMDGEIALHAVQLRLSPRLQYCLPVLAADRRLAFAPWRPGAPLATNRHGIPEPDVAADALLAPEALALVLVPLVAFDRAGHRLGMGGGWYDRSFAFRNDVAAARDTPLPRLVGVGFDAQRVESLPQQPWDVTLDAVCTEQDTYLAADA